jgi:hypothetical protein
MMQARTWSRLGLMSAIMLFSGFRFCDEPESAILAQNRESNELVRLVEEVLATPPVQVNDPRIMIRKLVDKNPRGLLEAFLDYGRQPGLVNYGRFEVALPEWGKYLGGAFRPLLLDYLKLCPDGNLVRQEGDLRQGMSRAAVAYYFLRVIDAFDEFPWAKNGIHDPKVPRPRIEAYPQILRAKGSDLPAAVVEYLFSEYLHEAWIYFSRGFEGTTDIGERNYKWYSHVLAQALWRLDNGHTKRVNSGEVREAFSKLLEDRAWYSRRYIVHVLLQHASLGDEKVIQRLQRDPHPLVRERARALKLAPSGE